MPETKCGFDDLPDGSASGADLLMTLGPTLIVDVGFDDTYSPTSGKIPTPGIRTLPALVDTGASESCIDNLLAAQLKLPIIDRRPISGAGGQHMANMYLAQVHVIALGRTISGAFAGVDLKAGGQVHSALIGRTFLRHYRMTYDGTTGTVIISNEQTAP
jgi:predicted aspartyl protease